MQLTRAVIFASVGKIKSKNLKGDKCNVNYVYPALGIAYNVLFYNVYLVCSASVLFTANNKMLI